MKVARVASGMQILCVSGLCFCFICLKVFAAFEAPQIGGEALLVVGLSAQESEAQTWNELVETTRQAWLKRGFGADRIQVLANSPKNRVTRQAILTAIQSAAGRMEHDDTFWLVLFGHGRRGRDEQPVFQVSGTRLSAKDLQQALSHMAGRKFVMLGASSSGAFLPIQTGSNTRAIQPP